MNKLQHIAGETDIIWRGRKVSQRRRWRGEKRRERQRSKQKNICIQGKKKKKKDVTKKKLCCLKTLIEHPNSVGWPSWALGSRGCIKRGCTGMHLGLCCPSTPVFVASCSDHLKTTMLPTSPEPRYPLCNLDCHLTTRKNSGPWLGKKRKSKSRFL